MTPFSAEVYRVVATIPRGRVVTYGQIAQLAGSARAARAVGQLMAHNKNPKNVPCHRVVGSTGAMTGYAFDDVSAKHRKLLAEGVTFKGTRVNLAVSLWNY